MKYKVLTAKVTGNHQDNRTVELPDNAIIVRGILTNTYVLEEIVYLLKIEEGEVK